MQINTQSVLFINWQTESLWLQPERCLFYEDYGCRFYQNNLNAILQPPGSVCL